MEDREFLTMEQRIDGKTVIMKIPKETDDMVRAEQELREWLYYALKEYLRKACETYEGRSES